MSVEEVVATNDNTTNMIEHLTGSAESLTEMEDFFPEVVEDHQNFAEEFQGVVKDLQANTVRDSVLMNIKQSAGIETPSIEEVPVSRN